MVGQKAIERFWIYSILIVGSVLMAFPMVYAVLGSLTDLEDFYANPWLPIPRKLYLENYTIMFSPEFGRTVALWRWVFNTLVRTAWYIAVPGTVAVLAGYVFSRLKFRGRDAAFLYLLSSMMVPGIVFWIPTYVMMARFPGVGGNNWLGQGGHGFVNEFPALMIPGLVNVFYIFMLRQAYYSIPVDFEEAARVDGATTLQVLWHVYLPMLKPVLIVLVIFQFVAIWNDYQWPLIVSSGNPDIWTVALGIQRMLFVGAQVKGYPAGTVFQDYPFSFALATMATLPLVLLFLRLQSYFVEGVQGFALRG
ncbi:MAG TPA: carbohydrate ABC transporter permease [Caldilineaceae bacterium]|nr:carbohydrate ABC transporter permease [Caldilineaceae bacterium]